MPNDKIIIIINYYYFVRSDSPQFHLAIAIPSLLLSHLLASFKRAVDLFYFFVHHAEGAIFHENDGVNHAIGY